MRLHKFTMPLYDKDLYDEDEIEKLEEEYQRKKQQCEDLGIEFTERKPQFHFDTTTEITIDLSDISYYFKNWVQYNGDRLECVSCVSKMGVAIPPLIISYEEFNKIFNNANNI